MGFLGFIKNFFKRNKYIELPIKKVEKLKNEYDYNETEETITLDTKKLSNELSNIEKGTIIYANRYDNEEEMEQIPIGHRRGSYLVLGKNDNYLLCFTGTGVFPEKIRKYRFLKVIKDIYDMKKETYFHLNNIEYINDERFLNTVDNLDKEDMITLNKHLSILKNRGYYDKFDLNISLEDIECNVGDVISFKSKLYFIIETNKESYKCIELTKNFIDDSFKVDGLYFNLNNIIDINKSSNIKLMNYVSGETLDNILSNINNYFIDLDNKKYVQRGSVVIYNNEYYYVYGEEGNNWLLFKLYNDFNEEYDELSISSKVFYTDYKNNIKLDKDCNIKNYILATEEEIDIIKDKKKHYKKTLEYKKFKEEQEKKKQEYYNPYFKPGVIVMAKDFSRETYIIIDRDYDLISCISIKELDNNRIVIRDFSSSQIMSIKVRANELKRVKDKIEYLTNNKISENSGVKIELNRGVVIKRKDSYFYIYGTTGNNWMLFEIYKEKDVDNKYNEITIKDLIFYTDFSNLITLNKNLIDYEIIAIANDLEIENIRKSKKSYNKKNNKSYKEVYPTKLYNGVVIEDRNNLGTKYVIYDYGSLYSRCISLDDLNSGIKKIKTILTSDLIISDSIVYDNVKELIDSYCNIEVSSIDDNYTKTLK
ncbi:MAG: hypothetical protein IJD92_03130 [Bacilli bacterium]|nr:hypothetical protein [Bacilli bacterium]